MPRHDIVLAVEQALVVDHLVKDRGSHGFHAHRCRRARASAHGLSHGVGHQPDRLLIALAGTIDNRRYTVAVLNGVDLFIDAVATGIEPCLKARHVVGLNARKHILYGRDHRDPIGPLSLAAGTVVGRIHVFRRVIIRSPLTTHHGR